MQQKTSTKNFFKLFEAIPQCSIELLNDAGCDATGDDSCNSAYYIIISYVLKKLIALNKTDCTIISTLCIFKSFPSQQMFKPAECFRLNI